ncbi:MAG: HD domain-containing protein [Clostridia bacterium]|nr:HD domain-containing protein [Clostridia bacterium]
MSNMYLKLSKTVEKKITEDRAKGILSKAYTKDGDVYRKYPNLDKESVLRPSFVRDISKILNCVYYNRYADKTQVFSLYRNDDISRRSLHVQLVSRIARDIGALLGLNLHLIEAIALGHDLGHTPFGHKGEEILSKIYFEHTGRYFLHNVQSVRVLHKIFPSNISLQTLDGILCHNGEREMKNYKPQNNKGFDEFDNRIEECYLDCNKVKKLVPSTLEGCVVRISDIIAYLGKDRQDAGRAKIQFDSSIEGLNGELINNIIVSLIENSYGKDYIIISDEEYARIQKAKEDNNSMIYKSAQLQKMYEPLEPMFRNIYEKMLADLLDKKRDSLVYDHHIDYVKRHRVSYIEHTDYEKEEPNQLVVDYIASMTDDYFIDLHSFLFPESPHKLEYITYFGNKKRISAI